MLATAMVSLSFVYEILIWALPLLFAVILHEVAHGYVAFLLGDPTAKRAGRLTLNPLPHVDPFGTVALPLFLLFVQAPFLFGYARPVPVDFGRLRHPRRDMVLVALAGPVANLVQAALFALVFPAVWVPGLVPAAQSLAAQVVYRGVLTNVVLAVFNLLPVPPVDGGRVLVGLLPASLSRWVARLEPYGMLIIVALLVTNVANLAMRPVIAALLRTLL